MVGRFAVGVVVGLVFLAGAGIASCGNSSGANLSANCSINTDCNAPLVCTFARCHEQCAASRDCPSGERCISSPGTGGVCQLSLESTCGAGNVCHGTEVCGADQQCRTPCTSAGGCQAGDYCVMSAGSAACYSATNSNDAPTLIMAGILAADGAVISDASVVTVMPDGSSGPGLDGSSPDGSGGAGPDSSSGGGTDTGTRDAAGSESSVVVNSCPSAQTQFGNIAQGDSNPNFVSGVGVRGPNDLFIFDGYHGPDPVGDGGTTNYM
jgi:hypothetical protein